MDSLSQGHHHVCIIYPRAPEPLEKQALSVPSVELNLYQFHYHGSQLWLLQGNYVYGTINIHGAFTAIKSHVIGHLYICACIYKQETCTKPASFSSSPIFPLL